MPRQNCSGHALLLAEPVLQLASFVNLGSKVYVCSCAALADLL